MLSQQTLTLPLVKTASVLTTLGTSFALQPPQEPTTRSASSVVVFDGSSSFNIPPLFQKTTLTTGGRTVTVSPEGPPTITIEKPPTGDASSTSQAPKVIVVGGSSITIDSVTRETVLTTNGQVLTLAPDTPPTVTANQPPSPTTTTTEKDIGPLPVYTTWPAGAVITPVAVEVDKPKKSDDDDKSSVIPCKLWFFSLCIKFEAINILGWKLSLPPGIYPPGPPPIPNIKFPPPIAIKGSLPPWPKFTVGNDYVPTFPSEPEPTKCETKTASMCSTTTSGSGTTACSTQTAAPKTGCSESVTASTTTLSCRASATEVREWLVWPKDGKVAEQTKSVFAKLEELVGDENKIRVSDNESVGVLYWSVMLEKGQEEQVKKMEYVLSLHPQCTRNCGDPTTQGNEISGPARDTHWRYQSKYIDEVHWLGDGRAQMAFLSQSKKEEKRQIERQQSEEGYIFDESVGEDIPVYIIDSGANLNHPDFQKIKDKVEWIHVGKDYDGEEHKDDSYLPVSQACPQVIVPFDPFEEGNGHKLCTSHGTSMLSFVTGNYLGTSKTIKPYLVRIPRLDPDGRGAKPSHWLDAVSLVSKTVPAKSDKTVAILSLAWHWVEEEYIKAAGYEQTDFTGWRRGLGTMIQTLIEHGVFVVTGAGNEFNMHGWPALYNLPENKIWGSIEKYRATWQYIPDLLVLGALDPANGQRWAKSGISPDYTYPELYAPGENIVGVVGDENAWPHPPLKSEGIRYDVTQGTSCATSITAGLAAYFLKMHQLGRLPPDAKGQAPDMSPGGLKRYIMNNAWIRAPLTDDKIKTPPEKYGFRGIWNGSPRERVEKEGICPGTLVLLFPMLLLRISHPNPENSGYDKRIRTS
ncbi:hypothetical protein PG987_010742 [Apiospora arundinis]